MEFDNLDDDYSDNGWWALHVNNTNANETEFDVISCGGLGLNVAIPLAFAFCVVLLAGAIVVTTVLIRRRYKRKQKVGLSKNKSGPVNEMSPKALEALAGKAQASVLKPEVILVVPPPYEASSNLPPNYNALV